MNNNLNIKSEISELLLNSDFLRLIKDFLNFCYRENYFNYLNDDKDINNFIIKLMSSDLKNEIPFTKKEILIYLGDLFSNKRFLGFFSEYIETYNITYETTYMFSIVGDYLLSINQEQEHCANKITYITDRLEEKVGNILYNKKFENPIFKLQEAGFPLICEKGKIIIDVSLEEQIDLYGNGDKNGIYIKVLNDEGTFLYMNNEGKHLITNEKQIIEGNNYFYYQEVKISGNDGLYTKIFDKDFNELTLFDLFVFLNEGDNYTIKMLGKTLDRYKNILLSGIGKFYDFNGEKFIQFSKSDSDIKKYILRSNGNIVVNQDENDIEELFEMVSIGGYDFIQFGLFDSDYKNKEIEIDLFNVDGLIDSNGDVVDINDKTLIKVQEMDYKGLEYFIINDDQNFIITKYELLEELKYYKPFNRIDKDLEEDIDDEEIDVKGRAFSFIFDEEKKVHFDGKEIEKIIGRIDEKGKLITYIKVGGVISIINNIELENELAKNNTDKEVLDEYKVQIDRISNI